ncbi:MAG: HAMP domain-containing histidine kinase [Cyanobacteria bacterium]|nr:HAMP domain-containing histidine kinase [Cyanobacteriota bacterium]
MFLYRTKLAHQAGLLVVVPLIFEICCITWFYTVLSSMESSLAREAQAKKTISQLTDLMSSVVQLQIIMGECGFDRETFSLKYPKYSQTVRSQCRKLKELVKDDRQSLVLAKQATHYAYRVIDMAEQLKDSFNPDMSFTFAEFLHDGDFWMEAFYAIRMHSRLTDKLVDHCNAEVAQIQPLAARQREELRIAVTLLLTFNILIAMVLAIHFSSTTVKRLRLLMTNINRFKTGDLQLEQISGADEIAALDRSFRQMAQAKNRSERLRRDMVAMVSHDLKTPLSGTAGYVSLMIEGVYGEPPDEFSGVLARIQSELNRLMRLANDLLDIEKIESGSMELDMDEYEVEDIVDSSIETVRVIAEAKQISLSIACTDDLTLNCDSDRIIQVLVNLLSNAIKYSKDESKVEIIVQPEPRAVRFSVTDQGDGMALETQSIVFDRYKLIEQDRSLGAMGRGLGLSICKKIVELHGGEICVESEPGKGSCFWFTIPRKESVNE